MWRAFLEPIALFLSPFIVYALFLAVSNGVPFKARAWTSGVVSSLTLAGLAIAALSVLLLGFEAPRGQGAYTPAHMENGRLVPGRIQ